MANTCSVTAVFLASGSEPAHLSRALRHADHRSLFRDGAGHRHLPAALRQHFERFLHGRPRNDRLGGGTELSLRQSGRHRTDGLGGFHLSSTAFWPRTSTGLRPFPSMVFLGLVMMPFYYISKTHSVPGYLQLRYGESTRALSGISFAFMTILMSGINMYAMALVMKVVLGWNIHFSIWVSSLTVAVYVALGGLYSAIFNEVLQFFLIWLGALVIPILGMIEVGGWSGLHAENLRAHAHERLRASVEHAGHVLRQSDGRALDRNRFRPGRRHRLRLLDDGFPGGAARHGGQGSALGANGADHCVLFQDDGAADRDSSRTAGPGGAALQAGAGERRAARACTVTTKCCR